MGARKKRLIISAIAFSLLVAIVALTLIELRSRALRKFRAIQLSFEQVNDGIYDFVEEELDVDDDNFIIRVSANGIRPGRFFGNCSDSDWIEGVWAEGVEKEWGESRIIPYKIDVVLKVELACMSLQPQILIVDNGAKYNAPTIKWLQDFYASNYQLDVRVQK